MAGWPGLACVSCLVGLGWLLWAGLLDWVDGWAWPRAYFLHILGWLAWAAARNQESNPLCSCWMPALSLYVFLLHYVGHCGLMFLLDASQLTGIFFLNHIGWCGLVFLLDASLVIACNVRNYIGRCGLVFLLDVSLVVGCIYS